MNEKDIDPQIYDFYDEYCHGHINRREFLRKAGTLAIGTVAALSMAEALMPQYLAAQTISFTDDRIKANYVEYASPGGNSGTMRGYLVKPAGEGPYPSVLVVHENRGLNPHIEDVARRAAVEGFLALAPDGLAPVGGYPGNDDDGRSMQRALDRDKLKKDMLNSAYYLKAHPLAAKKLGVTGFCWGGSISNYLAATMGSDLAASVPFYGSGVTAELVENIKAPIMIQAAEDDKRINAAWPDFEKALKEYEINYQRHLYLGTKHGFHNNSTPRYHAKAAELAWKRTIEFFREHLV